jgi:MFS transporter, DHA2 family, multidrug resistance protein
MVVVWRLCDIDKPDRTLARGFDYIGVVSMALFLGGLEYALEEGPRHDWFDEPAVLRWTVIAGVAGVVFFWRSLTYRNPIVQLRAFKNRNFAFGVTLQLLLGAGLFGATFLVPLYLAQVRNLDAVQIGIVMMIGGIFMVPTAPISSFLITRIDPRLQIGMGALIVGSGFYMVTGITKDWDFWELFLPQACRSVGLMLIFPPVTRLALGTLPPDIMKSASSLFNLMRQLGGAIGLAVLASILTDRTQFHWQRLAQHVNPARPEVQAYMDRLTESAGQITGADPQAFAMRRIAALVTREATVMSFGDAFFALSMAFFAMAGLLVFVSKPSPAPAAPPPLTKRDS